MRTCMAWFLGMVWAGSFVSIGWNLVPKIRPPEPPCPSFMKEPRTPAEMVLVAALARMNREHRDEYCRRYFRGEF